ncbi:hypothetical protein TVAG_422640 [Trichomonas vaginalis G3]|uniref:Uncharacterized protein n=1 Tax=Trichomonas vaginalis (strain ATCC PRA-98 / G3) TaxID=412133 RepID=A2G407_TRIV3|nr:spectrin binding [Trichomonas vaginalis G3]EAX88109.1 hypothetical protein TVAG_422640 [Trichomonas vaginalis G3]KAI5535208.1 spectrin binding [Trichomonas vaginalis G3]|eukprot:XP_001301039.1 hypothetical protein [Trichomonas vaginalis G3]
MARSLITGCLRAVDEGATVSGYEVAMSQILDDCFADELFYHLPLTIIGEVIEAAEDPIPVEKATKLLDEVYKVQGPDSVLLLQYIQAGAINYEEALMILSPFRTFNCIAPLFEEVDPNQLQGFILNKERQIEYLNEQIRALKEENQRMKEDFYCLTKGTLAQEKSRALKKAELRISQLRDLFKLAQKGQSGKLLSDMNVIDAVKSGNLEAVRILCGNDPSNLEVSDAEYESTPLHWAAGWGMYDIVKLLLDFGADINARNKVGHTPLLCAVFDNQLECARLLIDRGADVNDCDNEGFAAIHIAAGNGHMDVLKFLVTKGADLGALTIDGGTALWVAAGAGDYEIFEFLLSGCRIPLKKAANRNNTIFHQAAFGGNLQIIKLCFKAGLDINAKNDDGETPLALAKNKMVAEYLSQKGAVL